MGQGGRAEYADPGLPREPWFEQDWVKAVNKKRDEERHEPDEDAEMEMNSKMALKSSRGGKNER